VDALRARGLPEDRLARVRAPAGLDLGASTPEEIAVSILAEIVARRRSPERAIAPRPAQARDPIFRMTVPIATARHPPETPAAPGYFCGPGCRRAFDASA